MKCEGCGIPCRERSVLLAGIESQRNEDGLEGKAKRGDAQELVGSRVYTNTLSPKGM